MTNGQFDQLFGAAARKSAEAVSQFHKDIACSVQRVTEEVMLRLTSSLSARYGVDNLCMAGGVALNCVINSAVLRHSGFKQVWIQPAAGDAGGAIGAAYAIYYEYLNQQRDIPVEKDLMQNALLGPDFTDEAIQQALTDERLPFVQVVQGDFHNQVAQCIADGKVVGYFNGRMEFGPRALGSRSILADPHNPAMQSILNQKIKFREGFRPFAPAILEEFATSYFGGPDRSPYMLFVGDCKVAGLPAVTHVDGTARVQTVNSADHPDFYQLITAFYALTGCPLVINTSFNVMDEPIVCSPPDAIRCFKNTDIDVLAIGRVLVFKDR